jgi:hypothetical protein
MPDFSLDFFGSLFEYTFMDHKIKRLLINHMDYWWWLNSTKGVSSP